MALIDGRTGMEHLAPPACWKLLASTAVGRIGVMVDGAPEIYPVNYAVDGDSVVFRIDPGSKLRALEHSPSVCFEVDDFDDRTLDGWSVMVKGRAEAVRPEDRARAEALPLELWVGGHKAHWIRVRPVEVTGRRIIRAD